MTDAEMPASTVDDNRARWLAHLQSLIAALLLFVMTVLSGGSALHESVTVDEIAHIGAGVSYLQKLDMRMNEEHPPLAKVLAAAPLVVRGVRADYSDVSWTFSGKGLFQAALGEWPWGHSVTLRWNEPYSTVFWARVPMLALALILGLTLYIFGSRLGGAWGGILCLGVYVSTPAFLAFGPLVLTDVAVTLFCILTMWAMADMWRSPGAGALLCFALALAGALLSKFSSGLLLFAFLAFALSLRWFPAPGSLNDPAELRNWRRLRTRYLWGGIALAALLVYAVYFVLSWNQPTDSLQRLGSSSAALIFRRALMPPWIYLRGLGIFILQSNRGTFILGHAYPHGVWFYFPVLFVLKSTIAFLALLAVGLAVAGLARSTLPRNSAIPAELAFHWRAVWAFLFVFVGACMFSRLDIGIRHFAVPLALLVLALAPLPRALDQLRLVRWVPAQVLTALVVVLVCASVTTAARDYPNYIPFLNSFSFGHPAYTLVNDSNLDWDQSLPRAESIIRQNGWQHVLVDEYGFSDPSVYIPGAEFWNCQRPSAADAGRFAVVSAGMIEDGHNCLWLMNYPHQAIAGGSMYTFQLPSVIPPAGQPGGPPPEAEWRTFGGLPTGGLDFRRIFFDCIRDPNQLQPSFDQIVGRFRQMEKKQ